MEKHRGSQVAHLTFEVAQLDIKSQYTSAECGLELIRIKLRDEGNSKLNVSPSWLITKSSKIHRLDKEKFSLINIRTFRPISFDLRKVGGTQEQEVQIRLPVQQQHAKSVSSINNKVRCNAFIGPKGGAGQSIIMAV